LESLEQLSADFPEQQDDFSLLLSAVEVFEEQHADEDLLELSLPPLSAVFEEQHDAPLFALSSLLHVDFFSAEVALPPSATLFAEEPPSLVCATSEVVVFAVEPASDCALTANAKNAKTLRIRAFFIKQIVWLFSQLTSDV
jgi:hypothetical protein